MPGDDSPADQPDLSPQGEDETPDEAVEDESQQDDEGLIDIGESALSYFGADFDISGLVRRLNDEDIVIPRFDPDETEGSEIQGFQRQRVWTMPRMEKFIESLLLGWPVPGIFLVLDLDQRYLVLDGQQRLTALKHFLSGRYPNGRAFRLSNEVADHLKGATYDTLTQESRRKLNNTFIQATVVEPKGDEGRESIYRLFGRLNSGGVALTPQEIRVALFRGPIIEWIRDLNQDVNWRRLFGAPHTRLKDQELVLRIMAMREGCEKIRSRWAEREVTDEAYKPPMADFLNTFLERHRNLVGIDPDRLKQNFASACEALFTSVGADGLRFAGRVNAAHVDAVLSVLTYLVGIERVPDSRSIRDGIDQLRSDPNYSRYVTRSTSHRESVIGRLQASTAAFAG